MTDIEIILYTLMATVGAGLLTLDSFGLLHTFQQEGYRIARLCTWLKNTQKGRKYLLKIANLTFLCAISLFVGLMLFGGFSPYYYAVFLLFACLCAVFAALFFREKKKVEFKYTPRVVRLILVQFMLWIAVFFVATYFTAGLRIRFLLIGALPIFIPPVLIASAAILSPIERLIHQYYFNKARQRLQKSAVKVVGITGSFGKTSVRGILTAMLKSEYNAKSTIKSYNTPMGISRLINENEELLNGQYFVAEMGARQKGDIAELCRLLQPSVGVITGIGNQHLQTFKTLENIAQTKLELAQNLQEGGFCAFNCVLEAGERLYEQCAAPKIGIASKGQAEGFYAYFYDVECSESGTCFKLDIDGQTIEISTPLLGGAAAQNIAVSAATAHKLGVPLEKIVRVAAELKPEPHRLQLIEGNGTTIIDDAYNSNINGAKYALEVLKMFDGVRVIITPGIVELGEAAKEVNKQLGEAIANCCDYAFVLGENAQAIKNGATSAGLASEKIVTAASLDEAVALASQLEGKKILLFENDLPDNL